MEISDVANPRGPQELPTIVTAWRDQRRNCGAVAADTLPQPTQEEAQALVAHIQEAVKSGMQASTVGSYCELLPEAGVPLTASDPFLLDRKYNICAPEKHAKVVRLARLREWAQQIADTPELAQVPDISPVSFSMYRNGRSQAEPPEDEPDCDKWGDLGVNFNEEIARMILKHFLQGLYSLHFDLRRWYQSTTRSGFVGVPIDPNSLVGYVNLTLDAYRDALCAGKLPAPAPSASAETEVEDAVVELVCLLFIGVELRLLPGFLPIGNSELSPSSASFASSASPLRPTLASPELSPPPRQSSSSPPSPRTPARRPLAPRG